MKKGLEEQRDKLTTSSKQIKKKDVINLVIPLHKESLKLQKKLNAVLKKIDNLEDEEFDPSE